MIRAAIPAQRYAVRRAEGARDMAAVLALRAATFRAGGDDRDGFDDACTHVMVEDADGLACTFRVMILNAGADLERSYAAARYDLTALRRQGGPLVELGRFCIRPGAPDADVLRAAWGALAGIVDAAGARMLIGCTSFPGLDAAVHADAFALLAARHLAPRRWAPLAHAKEVLRLPRRAFDGRAALRGLPPLLRTYLGMGGRVSDHAVIDRDLGTMHVFTGVEIARIPPARARALRTLARQFAPT